jgi:hypothetical protein
MGRSWLEAIPADLRSQSLLLSFECVIAFFSALFHYFRAVAGEGIPESYLPKTCVHQWEGHTKVEPFDLLVRSSCRRFFLGRQLHSMVAQMGSFVTERLSR